MILITGGNGFQGRALSLKLTELGYKVLSVSRKAWSTKEYISDIGNITDKKSMASIFKKYPIEIVVHLVSLLVTQSIQNPDRALRVNVMGTLNLLELCKEMGIRRFIYGSSYNVLGFRPLHECPVNESAELLPENFYGETKRFNEKLGITYAKLHGFEFISARLSILVGPGTPSATSAWRSDIFNLLKNGGEINFGFEPDEILPISHIEDSAEAMAMLILAERPKHSIYHIPSESIRASNLARDVERIGQGVNTQFGQKKLTDMPPIVSSDRIIKELGVHPMPLVERLQMYCKD